VIELDGGQHNQLPGQRTDMTRDARLRRSGFRVLRFWNNDVMANPEGVMEVVMGALRSSAPHP
jgi:adenine-specific DNA-methyltransferase